jgi:ABC-type arginine transport system permease subunit
MGLWMLLFAGSTPFGGFLTGYMAERVGVQAAIGFNAGMCAIGVSLASFYYVTHRVAIESVDKAQAPATAGAAA